MVQVYIYCGMHLHHIHPFAKNFLKLPKDAQSVMLFSSVDFYSTDITCTEFIWFNCLGLFLLITVALF